MGHATSWPTVPHGQRLKCGHCSVTLTSFAEVASDRRPHLDVAIDSSRWLPLYEAKMIYHFDHRWATYDGLRRIVRITRLWLRTRLMIALSTTTDDNARPFLVSASLLGRGADGYGIGLA